MNIFEFMSGSPFLTFAIAFMLVSLSVSVVNHLFRVWNRMMRMLNIKHHGWPPPHCDADGEGVCNEPEEEEEN